MVAVGDTTLIIVDPRVVSEACRWGEANARQMKEDFNWNEWTAEHEPGQPWFVLWQLMCLAAVDAQEKDLRRLERTLFHRKRMCVTAGEIYVEGGSEPHPTPLNKAPTQWLPHLASAWVRGERDVLQKAKITMVPWDLTRGRNRALYQSALILLGESRRVVGIR